MLYRAANFTSADPDGRSVARGWVPRRSQAHTDPDGDLARPRRFPPLNGYLQHAVAIFGSHLLRIRIVRQRDHSPEVTIEALAAVVLDVIVQLKLAAARSSRPRATVAR